MTVWAVAPLTIDDAPILAVLQNRLWRETYAGLLPQEVLDARDDAANTEIWRDRAAVHQAEGRSAEGARTLVAHEAGGTAIGWASLGPARGEHPPTEAELWSLYVAPEHHGRGAAQGLLAAIAPHEPLHVWVVQGNDRALAFYRKVGFVADGASLRDERLGADEVRLVRGAYTGRSRRG